MGPNRTYLFNWYILGTILLSPHFAISCSLPLEAYLWKSATASSCIFVGEVLNTLPFDATKPDRQSWVLVSENIFGTHSHGDSVLVNWGAREWHPTPEETIVVSCGGRELSSLVGEKVLWLLTDCAGHKCSARPLHYENWAINRIQKLIKIVEAENPEEEERRQFYLRRGHELEPDPAIGRLRLIEFLHAELARKK